MRTYTPGVDFYVPKYKQEYLSYFKVQYPQAKKNTFVRMHLDRLKAIYLALRTRRG